jgi:excinuclease UvrABC nuclease subunit
MRLFDGKFGSERLRELSHQPGVYLFLDAKGRVLYAGKANDLRRRLAGYRNASRRKAHRKMRTLLLENQLIRTLRPPYFVADAMEPCLIVNQLSDRRKGLVGL